MSAEMLKRADQAVSPVDRAKVRDEFLALFPDHPQARAMRDLLHEYLQKAE